MKEDRISQRVEIELPAKFCLVNEPHFWVKAAIVNISTHGFCFRTGAEYNDVLNSRPAIELAIKLSKKERVALNIQVAWSGKTSSYNCLAGGEILDPSGDDYQKILEFYTRLFREQSGKESGP